ncbi:MAG: adenylyltransferase/cytidyltransferase family protein [Porphyromonadaceae bacterium]|nr:adenylyltransferase/cytidyltransferase family protein [Porphyromonadaceae bacterium]
MEKRKKVFVSGCYDMLHSGHVAFFEEAATYGDLYVGIGSDRTVYELKARKTINTEAERLYMVKALRCVKDAWINSGSGLLDFEKELRLLRPDIFFVNSDGATPLKAQLCKELGIQYVVSKRIPHGNLPARSTTLLRKECRIPYRLDLAGGWLDQPFVSKYCAGPVLTVSVEPECEFNDRSGMASSTRKKAVELWQTDVPEGDKEKLAKMLFCFENPPGTKYFSGSQDSLGIVLPGVNKLEYAGDYWPVSIESRTDADLLRWIESRLWLYPLYPRSASYDVMADVDVTPAKAQALSTAARSCWEAILTRDAVAFGREVRNAFEAQIAIFPHMISDDILTEIERYRSVALGWKLSGAGGGGYLIFVSEKPIENAMQIHIRR